MALMAVDDMFDEFTKSMLSPFRGFGRTEERLQNYNPSIAMDVSETKDNFKVHVDLPGFEKNQIKIDLRDDGRTLTISGESKEEKKEENETYHVVQRRFGKFEKSVRLPKERCDLDNIHAEMKNGVLCVRIPKKEPAKKEMKQIQIQ